ncbi:hypothetical protein K7X08_013021 [Anisodus acutangulus]|uniref:Uncharacterized protein n=1 Tax=Anisodus acutangulus TaxID=402998 RepID=A0A9Q1ME21_9SOLA|nr:hypothetical protein K7X08_013021 [Anisodus acutangulus]
MNSGQIARKVTRKKGKSIAINSDYVYLRQLRYWKESEVERSIEKVPFANRRFYEDKIKIDKLTLFTDPDFQVLEEDKRFTKVEWRI